MASTKQERSIRLLGRKTLDLDRITGSNGEVFYDTDTQSLRIYSSGGSSVVLATRTWVTANSPQSDWNQATSTAADFIKNKPVIPTNTNQLTNGAGFITATGIPAQTGNSGKYLTTNGTAVSWATVTATVTASDVGLGNVTNESKATMFASPTFTGNSSVTGSLNVGQTILTSRFLSSPYQLVVPRGPVYQGTGVLSTLTTAIATNDYPEGIAVDPTGRFVYVANRSGGVGLFSINQTTGVLTGGSIQSAGTTPYAVTVDPTGRFLYVTNSGSASVSQFSINQTTGALTSITTAITTGTQPVGIAVDPTGRFVYVTNNSVNTVSQFSINQTTGALTSITTAIASGASPYGIAVDPTGRFVYVTNNGGTSVSQYSIDQTTGALTSITTAIASGSSFPLGIAVDPTGRFVYVANRNNSTVSQYLINQITGALTTITTAIALPASAGPIGVTVDPTGRFVYVVNEYFDTVNQLLINQATGALTTITTAIASGDRPVTVIVDPTGRFVYVVNQHGFGGNQPGSISQYSINNFSAGQSIISSPVNSTNTQTGALQVVGGVGVGGNLNVGGTLSVAGSTSGSITLQAGATPSSQTYTLPSAYPAANGYALTSTTGGVLSWDTVATLPTQTSNIGRILTTDGTTASWITPASSRLKLLTNSTGTVSHGFSDGPVWRHSSISANFTANFNGVPTTEGTVLTVTLQLVQGATPYMPTAVQVEGVTAGSILWFGGVSTGNANKTNVVIFTMIRSSSTWAVLGEVKSYG